VLPKHLLKPDFRIDFGVNALVEPSWLMILLCHAVDKLAPIRICERGNIACHLNFLGVVLFVDGARRLIFEMTFLDVVGV